jgi:hypothetical protein
MEAGPAAAHQARARHRHELRTLTYVTLDQANGGIVRNLTHDGIAVQAVAAVRPRQQLRIRFELRYPRLRVETRGEVVWSTFSGQCGIRFLDLSPRVARQIDEWIFGDLLEGLSIPCERAGSLYIDAASSIAAKSISSPAMPSPSIPPATAHASAASARVLHESKPAESEEVEEDEESEEEDGLIVSPAPVKVIELPVPAASPVAAARNGISAIGIPAVAIPASPVPARVDLDWLSQPLSGRGLAWTVDTLVVIAASLLFALVFLSVTREAPKWPVTMSTGAAIVVAGMYWGFFRVFGGVSLGARLARLAGMDAESDGEGGDARFR